MPAPNRRTLDRLLLAGCVVALGVTVLYPALRMLGAALTHWRWEVFFPRHGRASWRATLAALLSQEGERATLDTLVISLASVLTAGVAGTGLAMVLSRFAFPGRRYLAAAAYLPFALPPLVGVLSFYYLIGRDGFLPRALEALLHRPHLTLSGPWAILLIHTYSFYVFFFAMVSTALEDLDASLLEAARTLGAGSRRVFFRVTLPLLKPALLGAALLTFMSSAASFSAPYFFGADFPMLSVRIFEARDQNREAVALTLTVALACVSLLGVLLFRSRSSGRRAASKGVRTPPRSQAGRILLPALAWAVMVLLLIPHLTIVWLSLVDQNRWHTQIFPTMLTWRNYTRVIGDVRQFIPIRNSLWTSALAAAGTLVIGVPCAYLIGRRRPGGRWVNILVMIPWALPGTVIAMNLIAAFNDRWLPLYNTIWILPLAYFVRNVPLVTRMATAAVEPFDTGLIEAGQTLGASHRYCFAHIALPLLAPAIVAGGTLAFATSLGEFVASILLYVPANLPISMKIFEESRGSDVGSAFAYGVFLMLLVSAAFVLSRRFASRVL